MVQETELRNHSNRWMGELLRDRRDTPPQRLSDTRLFPNEAGPVVAWSKPGSMHHVFLYGLRLELNSQARPTGNARQAGLHLEGMH